MKVILFFIILWNTMPIQVEKQPRAKFNTMEECQEVIDSIILSSVYLGLPIVAGKNKQGKILDIICEQELTKA